MAGNDLSYVVVVVVLFLGCCRSQMTIESLEIRSDIRYRFATTLVTSTITNDQSENREAVFEVILPDEAFISNFSMIISGKEYVGKVNEKSIAKQEYQAAKDRGQSAGYISNKARHSNTFNVKVNVAQSTSVTFHLTYQQLLVRCHGYYEQKIHVNPRQKVNALKIELYIKENREITYLETPGLTNEIITDVVISENTRTTVQRPSPRTAYIKYEPSLAEQGADGFHSKQFVVHYDVARTSPAGEVLVVDGYFVHFFAPQDESTFQALPKDIVFIIDVSGSMVGRKMTQVKSAMTTILDELREEDRFNILTFHDKFKMWKSSMVPANTDYILNAKHFVDNMVADGATDIQMAFDQGLQFLINDRDSTHVPIVFFLTDGQPTSGVRDPSEIAAAVKRGNEGIGAIFSLAFGDDADYDLLKKISAQNDGIARKIYEASDASKQVEGFYNEISTTILTSVKIEYLNSTVDPQSLTKTHFKNFFNGSEIVICGRISNELGSQNSIGLTVTGKSYKGDVVLILPESSVDSLIIGGNPFFSMPRDLASILEKSWAYLTIKNLLQKKLQSTSILLKDDIDKRVVEMSLKYNFVTPLTAMVTTQSEQVDIGLEGDDYKDEGTAMAHYSSASHMKAMMPWPSSSQKGYGSGLPGMSSRPMLHHQSRGYFDDGSVVFPLLQSQPMTTRYNPTIFPPSPPTTDKIFIYPRGGPRKSKTKNKKTKGKKKYGRRNKMRKNRKCNNVSLGHLEGVAIQTDKLSKKPVCSKLHGRIKKSGGFNMLPLIPGGPQVVLFFKKGPARFINGLEKISVTSSGSTLEVNISALNPPIGTPYSEPFTISASNDTGCCCLTVTCPDISVVMYKRKLEQKNKCFDSYFISLELHTNLPTTKGRSLDVWNLMHKGKTLNKRRGLVPNPVCHGQKVNKLKLKKPTYKNHSKPNYVIYF